MTNKNYQFYISHNVVPSGNYLLVVRQYASNKILKLCCKMSHMYIMAYDDMFRSDSTILKSYVSCDIFVKVRHWIPLTLFGVAVLKYRNKIIAKLKYGKTS